MSIDADHKSYWAACNAAWEDAWSEIAKAKESAWAKYHQRVAEAVKTHLREADYAGAETPTASQMAKPDNPWKGSMK